MKEMDIDKLTPAPWTVEPSCVGERWGFDVPELPEADYRDSRFGNKADAEFIALARNAFDVMMRRGWVPYYWESEENWGIQWKRDSYLEKPWLNWLESAGFPDPFTALVEADRWYREHVETTPTP